MQARRHVGDLDSQPLVTAKGEPEAKVPARVPTGRPRGWSSRDELPYLARVIGCRLEADLSLDTTRSLMARLRFNAVWPGAAGPMT
jgi:hypothetical protein